MMWLWLAVVVSAGPPAAVDVADAAAWQIRADVLLDGPAGCWEVVGRARWDYRFAQLGESRGDALFVARLDEGVWTEFHVEPLGGVIRRGRRGQLERSYGEVQRFTPLLGRMPDMTRMGMSGSAPPSDDDLDKEPVNYVREALNRLGGEAEVSWSEWDEDREAVVLHRVLTLADSPGEPEAEVQVVFPGGEPGPTELEVHFPERFPLRRLPPVSMRDVVVKLRGKRTRSGVLPLSESYRFSASTLGLRFVGKQTIWYRHMTACRVSEAPP